MILKPICFLYVFYNKKNITQRTTIWKYMILKTIRFFVYFTNIKKMASNQETATNYQKVRIGKDRKIQDIASLRINLSLKTVQLSPPIFGQFGEKTDIQFFP